MIFFAVAAYIMSAMSLIFCIWVFYELKEESQNRFTSYWIGVFHAVVKLFKKDKVDQDHG